MLRPAFRACAPNPAAQRSSAIAATLVLAVFGLSGCDQFQNQMSDALDEIPDLTTPGSAQAAVGTDDLDSATVTISDSSSSATDAPLSLGEQFSAVKMVEQELKQQTSRGEMVNRSRLEVNMLFSVEEIRGDQHRIGVEFQRVQFSQEINGQRFDYDSTVPVANLPVDVQIYAGLVNNGFSYWADANHRVIEFVGFDSFLERCVSGLAPVDRQAIFTMLKASCQGQEVERFLDETVGVLAGATTAETPGDVDAELRVGQTWTKQFEQSGASPIMLNNKYTVTDITEGRTEIDILGTYMPTTAQSAQGNQPQVAIRSGHVIGHCTVDRRSGLPMESQLQRQLSLMIHIDAAQVFEQQKFVKSSFQLTTAGQSGFAELDLPPLSDTEPVPPLQWSFLTAIIRD